MSVAVGVTAYCLTLMALWALIGCPDGPEKTLWHILRSVRGGSATLSAELEFGGGVFKQSPT